MEDSPAGSVSIIKICRSRAYVTELARANSFATSWLFSVMILKIYDDCTLLFFGISFLTLVYAQCHCRLMPRMALKWTSLQRNNKTLYLRLSISGTKMSLKPSVNKLIKIPHKVFQDCIVIPIFHHKRHVPCLIIFHIHHLKSAFCLGKINIE